MGRPSLFASVFHLLSLTALASQSIGNSSTLLNGWYPCSKFTDDYANNSVQAQCVIYNAPMCYPGVCEADSTKTLEVFVKRIQAVNIADNALNVWFLQSGPRYSSIAMEQLMVDLHAILRGTVNVYTMDHRGTGRSSFLDCIASQATTAGSPRGNDFDMSKVPGCAQELEIKYGSDLSMFSITSAANEMASFISTFLADSTTFVYGVSYGTAVVERLIHLAPKEVVGYILDGVSTTSGSDLSNFAYFSSWDQQFNKVGNAYMDLCTEDPACSKYFSFSNISSVGRNLVSGFDKEPDPQCVTILREYLPDSSDNDEPGHQPRMELAKVHEDFESREKIPKLIYLHSKCEGEDDAASGYLSLRKLSDKQQSLMEAAFLESDYRSQLLYYLIMFSELWEVPQVSQTTMLERFTNATIAFKMMNYANLYCAFSRENSMACADFPSSTMTSAEYQPIVYQRDQHWNKGAEIPAQASVLIMNGKLDPQTPYTCAELLLDALIGENKRLVTFNYAPHATIVSTPMAQGGTCGMYVLASYVFNHGNTSMTNLSCVEDHNALGLNVSWDEVFAGVSISPRSSSRTISRSIAISDVATTSSDTSSSSSSPNDVDLVAVIVALVALLLVLLIFMAFVANYIRSKRSAQKPIIQEDASIRVVSTPIYGGAYEVAV